MKVITVLSCKLIAYKVHGNSLNVKSKMAHQIWKPGSQ